MKKFIKYCALTGLVLLVAGIAIISVSAAFGGRPSTRFPGQIWNRLWNYDSYYGWDGWDDWDDWIEWDDHDGWDEHDDGNHQSRTNAPIQNIRQRQWKEDDFQNTRKLDIDINYGSLRIFEAEGISQIEIKSTDKYNAIQCYMDNEILKIKRNKNHYRGKEPQIEILVPVGYRFDKVSLDMGAAQCRMNQISTHTLEIDAGVGDVSYTGSVTGDVELEAGVGSVTLNLTGSQEDYNYNIECGVGTIQVGSEKYTMLSNDTYVNHNAPYTMDLSCGVGSVQVNFDESL